MECITLRARVGLIAISCSVLLVGCNRPENPAAGPPITSAPQSTGDLTPSDPATVAAPQNSAEGSKESGEAGKAVEERTDKEATNKDHIDKKPSSTDKKHAQHHEPLFVEWPKPQFVLLLTGQQKGFIEPCGCTGLVNQKGGLARRHTLAKQLAERGWPVVALDCGTQIHRFDPQSEIKFQRTAEALRKIGYQGIALGADDLRLSTASLLQTVADTTPTPFVSANAAVLEASFVPTFHIIEAGGKKIGITSVVSSDWQKKIMNGDILLKTPDDGLAAVLPKLREAKCDVLVLLAQASVKESQKLAQKYQDFHVVVTAGGIGEPTYQPEPVPDTNSILVQVGVKGMFVGVIGFFDDPNKKWRYQRVPLDSRFGDSPEMIKALAEYQEQLKTLGLEGLGVKPLPHSSGRTFVGSEKCGECHSKSFAKWKETGHSHATDSLVRPKERSAIPRHFDPECLSCHVTGWNPQQFIPFATGYLDLKKSAHLTGSGCENCHGPGSAHVAAEETNTAADAIKTLRESMRLPLAQAEQKCKECHDLDNSPDFHASGAFDEYWKRVEHKGKD